MCQTNKTNNTEKNDTDAELSQVVQAAVQKATAQAYSDWAAAHPSLAAVIDNVVMTELTTQSLRDSAEFRAAVAGYYESRNELDLVNQLMDLAGPILRNFL